MSKEISFHELHKKVKVRRLISKDIKKPNATDSSIEFQQSHIQQSYMCITSFSSEVPDLYCKKESELAHHSKLSYHSELAL